jgi:hypothetical protein
MVSTSRIYRICIEFYAASHWEAIREAPSAGKVYRFRDIKKRYYSVPAKARAEADILLKCDY